MTQVREAHRIEDRYRGLTVGMYRDIPGDRYVAFLQMPPKDTVFHVTPLIEVQSDWPLLFPPHASRIVDSLSRKLNETYGLVLSDELTDVFEEHLKYLVGNRTEREAVGKG